MNHQTVPLNQYEVQWQQRALDLFQRVGARVNPGQLAQPDGSYSILRSSGQERAAKIAIYQTGLGKGDWRPGPDGVYLCIRSEGRATTHHVTVGFLPRSEERFAFFRVE